ncbi:MAG TPA: sensor histidine kinase [Steroidobacteraceae bacterium]|jgi:signal transduction histidine kinase|nr:sensor histidine kinase [Steroidobacteraceae bacterium]
MQAVRPKPGSPASLEKRYREALERYLASADEAALTGAYELGRDALAQGRSIPDLVGIHGESLQALLASRDRRRGRDALLGPASAFLAEALAPFEMTHRGYRDSLTAWRHINETLEQEIKRIAHALHDESGQLLVSVHLQLAQLARALPEASPQVTACQALLEGVERQLRNLSHELRPMVLDDLGWLAAIEFLATAVSGRTRIPVEVRSSVTRRLSPPVEIALYRVVQEALTNATRHARASRIRVEIGQRLDRLHGLIGDDGVGFEVEACTGAGGLGLRGMRERLGALGGSLRVVSAPGRGAEIQFQLPLD